jgi:Fic family protein
MSAQIRIKRNDYYAILEKIQKGNLDITEWILWFLNCLDRALDASQETLSYVFARKKYWEQFENVSLNERQKFILNKLTSDFVGKLTTSKWAKIGKCSQDTALRDIQFLIEQKMLIKKESGGRSTNYRLPF